MGLPAVKSSENKLPASVPWELRWALQIFAGLIPRGVFEHLMKEGTEIGISARAGLAEARKAKEELAEVNARLERLERMLEERLPGPPVSSLHAPHVVTHSGKIDLD